MKYLIAFLAFPACAMITTGDIMSVASCNSIVDTAFYRREFTAKFGAPTRTEQGAIWYSASGEIYGTSIKEVFVSADPKLEFVGLVLEAKPTDILEKIKNSRMYPTNVYPNKDYWVGADGRNIMWHKGTNTKMFCTVNKR